MNILNFFVPHDVIAFFLHLQLPQPHLNVSAEHILREMGVMVGARRRVRRGVKRGVKKKARMRRVRVVGEGGVASVGEGEKIFLVYFFHVEDKVYEYQRYNTIINQAPSKLCLQTLLWPDLFLANRAFYLSSISILVNDSVMSILRDQVATSEKSRRVVVGVDLFGDWAIE